MCSRVRRWMVGILLLGVLILTGCGADCDTAVTASDKANQFPTGRFINNDMIYTRMFEFNPDGTWHYYEGNLEKPAVSGRYGISGNYYTEMTHDYPGVNQIPATYTWTFDGKELTFHLWGEDVESHRQSCYDGQTYILEE